MGKRVLIATGGTGGHIFPALGLASSIKEHEVIFAGSGLDKNRFFDQSSFRHYSVKSSTLSVKGLYRLLQGTKESLSLLKEVKPDLVVGFGSYHSLPLIAAAKLTSRPFILYEANAFPGKVNRLMAPFSRFVAVHFQEASKHLFGHVEVCQHPLREGFKESPLPREGARLALGLNPFKTTLLIFGGSQGAMAINQCVSKEVVKLDVQLIHLTGSSDNQALITHYKSHGIPALVLPYSDQMPLLFSAADLLIARAGASTIAEMVAYSVPAILIPYPFATNNHQEKNGDVISKKIGGAVMLKESELEENLPRLLHHLLGNQQEVCHAMRSALQASRMRQKKTLAELVEEELS